MTLPQTIVATATASEELPDSWNWIALTAFVSAAVLSVVLLVAALSLRTRKTWFYPVAIFALLAGSFAFGFSAYVYEIDSVALRPPGTEGALTIWQALWVPSLPVIASLTAILLHRARNNTPP